MKLAIIAVGKMKQGPEAALMQEYLKRLPAPVEIREVEERKKLSGNTLKEAEGALLLAAVPKGAKIIALDECGRQFTSREFAARLGALADGAPVALLIGGADGHSDEVRKRADLLLSFGSLTYPHMLVRVMLAEQLYRAHTILTRHPYHRD